MIGQSEPVHAGHRQACILQCLVDETHDLTALLQKDQKIAGPQPVISHSCSNIGCNPGGQLIQRAGGPVDRQSPVFSDLLRGFADQGPQADFACRSAAIGLMRVYAHAADAGCHLGRCKDLVDCGENIIGGAE